MWQHHKTSMDQSKIIETFDTYQYDCIKSFMETERFNVLSTKFGLDSQIVVKLGGADTCQTYL